LAAGLRPDPLLGGAYSALPDSLAGFTGWEEGKGEGRGYEREGRRGKSKMEKKGKGKDREGGRGGEGREGRKWR